MHSDKNNLCPDGYYHDELENYTHQNFVFNNKDITFNGYEFSTTQNSFNLRNDPDITMCQGVSGCSGYTITSTSTKLNVSIRCDGFDLCRNAQLTSTQNYGNIFCTGWGSCEGATNILIKGDKYYFYIYFALSFHNIICL